MDIWSTRFVYWMLEISRLKEKTAMIVLGTMGIQSFACSVARRPKQRVLYLRVRDSRTQAAGDAS